VHYCDYLDIERMAYNARLFNMCILYNNTKLSKGNVNVLIMLLLVSKIMGIVFFNPVTYPKWCCIANRGIFPFWPLGPNIILNRIRNRIHLQNARLEWDMASL